MKKVRALNLLASGLAALGVMACLQGNPIQESAAGKGEAESELAVAARTPIGSPEQPTKISTLAELRTLRTSGNYILTKNIDASSTANTPFVPIGNARVPFTGTFDGGNFTITNLNIKGSWQNTGLFSWAVNADLKRIRLVNVNVTGGGSTGGIVGFARNINLDYSYVTGTVTSTSAAEGQAGMAIGQANEFVRVTRCYATGTVKGTGNAFGGFVGRIYATGTHDPNPEEDFRVRLYEVYTDVTVSPNTSTTREVYSGGLAGVVAGGDFQDVHTRGSVTGRKGAGGLLGFVVNDEPGSNGTIVRSAMSRGVVTDAAAAGRAGTIGNSTGRFSWCSSLYDLDTDTGILNPNMPEPECQVGKRSQVLKNPHPAPNKLIDPYIHGMLVSQVLIDESPDDRFIQCMLGSGSDGDWGFGTCGKTPIWALNSETEYVTLVRIPNPGVQPKN